MNSIDSVVIHKLAKERHGKASIITRSATLPITEPVQKLVQDIHELYAERTGKGYGRFQIDEINYPASRILRETFGGKSKSFLDASKDLMAVLATKAGQAPLATGGYVLMAQVTNSAKVSWFLVAIITNIKGSAINDDSLEVVDSVHVDLQNLRVAGRVNLTDWFKAEKDIRYIGFLKQKGSVSDYFKLFLGCDELIASLEETKKLVAVLKEFAKNSDLKPEQQEDFLKSAHDYCTKCQDNDQPLILEALTNAIWPDDPKALQKALTTGDVQISDGFVPDGRSLKTLVKIKAKTPYWSIELDRRALISGQAKYDSQKHTLTLSSLPEGLEAELRGEFD